MTRTIIVIPAYNEASRLDLTALSTYCERPSKVELLFVDDGSTDNTRQILRDFCTKHPNRAALLALDINQGKAEAVRLGLLHALQQNVQFVGYFDADLATPLIAADEFLDVMNESPKTILVVGSRVKLLGRNIDRNPMRHYLGRVFATVASMVLKLAIYDTQCGAKLFRVDPTLSKIFEPRFLSHWIFDVEILLRLINQHGRLEDKVIEVPLKVWRDVRGSKVKMFDFIRAASELLVLWKKYPH